MLQQKWAKISGPKMVIIERFHRIDELRMMLCIDCCCCVFRMIDCFMVESPATSVAMAPNSIYLATTHADELGIYLW